MVNNRSRCAAYMADQPPSVKSWLPVVKEMTSLLRGRPEGQLPELMLQELRDCGAPAEQITIAPSEFDAVLELLSWAREGDVLVLPTHAERGRVTGLLEQLRVDGWNAGEPLPLTSP